MIKKIIFVLVILSVAVLPFNKLRSEKNKVENAPTPLNLSYSIKTTKVKKDRVDEKYPFLAQVQSSKEIKLATKLSGVIQKVYVSESQIVKKGELLVKIDDRALQTQLKTLMDTLKVQQKDVDYYEIEIDSNVYEEPFVIETGELELSEIATLVPMDGFQWGHDITVVETKKYEKKFKP